ncbi:unknown [Haloarcula marismortui ATCC 43049]|uniref:Uncharacterized protein n=2 Tax=Haloarcula marismortui (strain ATCC 43049 / DSM 3752 / JCM 8966 / VKM B-1809) TaxID=272569 RepID=Q5UWQ2_HALMA|nr:unknown [Haloarcula marismortui ATCC 43049]
MVNRPILPPSVSSIMEHDSNNRTSRNRHGRRRVLVSLGTAVTMGLVGCSGDDQAGDDGESNGGTDNNADGASGNGNGNGGSDSSGGSDGSDGSSVRVCQDIGSDYRRFEPGERPFAYTCDYPDVFGDQSEATPGFDENAQGLFIVTLGPDSQDGVFLQLNLQQFGRGTTQDQATFSETWEELTQTEFNGEAVTASLFTETARSKTFWGTYLPYEVDGRTLYFETKFTLQVSPEDEEVSDECLEFMEETAIHMTESLELNPDATGLKADPFVVTATPTEDG